MLHPVLAWALVALSALWSAALILGGERYRLWLWWCYFRAEAAFVWWCVGVAERRRGVSS